MKNFKKYYNKINKLVESDKPSKPKTTFQSGLIPRPERKEEKADAPKSAEAQVARYVSIIRKQKEELLNAKA